jgi:hypothetical protein
MIAGAESGKMAKADYARAAARAIGLHLPDDTPEGEFLTVGEWQAADQPEAVEAITKRRLKRVRGEAEIYREHGLPDHAAVIEQADFLTYAEYRRALASLDDIQRRLHQIRTQDEREEFNSAHKPHKPIFTPTYDPPTQNELTLYRLFNTDRFTADSTGYMAYIAAVNPAISELFFWKLPALIPEKDRELHTYITGSSGAGKSELMKVLVRAYVEKPKPPCIIVIDPHGKFADEVARQSAHTGRLIYINPALSKFRTPTINPFVCDQPERAEYIGKGLLGLFELLFMQENSAELSGNMRVLLNAILPALLRMKESDILTLQRILGADDEDKLFRLTLAHMEPQQREYIRKEWGNRSFESTKDALRKKIQTLASTPFLNFVCGQNTIDLDAAIKRRSVICLSLSKSDLDTSTIKAMGAFFLATLQAYIYAKAPERPESDPNRVPLHVFIDECHNFVSPTFKEILTEARKFGMHLTLAQQFAGQGMDDPDLKKAVLGNTGVKIAGFNNEKATQKAMAREMQLDEEMLIALPKHQFYVKTTDKKPFRLYPPKNLIGGRDGMHGEAWHALIGEQLGRYYRPIEPPKTAAEGKPRPTAADAPEDAETGMASDFVAPPPDDDFR